MNMKKTIELGAVHINANDVAKLAAYYENLGLDAVMKDDTVELKAGSQTLLVLHPTSHTRRHEVGLYHFALLLPSRADLGNFLYHVASSRIPVSGASDHHVSEAIYLTDPEGNGIEVYRDKEEDTWKVNGEVYMETVAMDVDGVLASRTSEQTKKFPQGTIMSHIHLHVQNLEESAKHYGATVGLEKILDYPGALFYARDGYHHHLGMNTWLGGRPEKKEDGYPGLRYFTVYLDSPVFTELFGEAVDQVEKRDPNNIRYKIYRGFQA